MFPKNSLQPSTPTTNTDSNAAILQSLRNTTITPPQQFRLSLRECTNTYLQRRFHGSSKLRVSIYHFNLV